MPRGARNSRVAPVLGWPAVWAAGVFTCAGALVANVWLSELDPLTAWGTAYGVAAAVLLSIAVAYSVRRRMPRRGPWMAYHWLRLHVFGGTFFFVLVLMHMGFRAPAGALGWALWVLSAWTVLSGAVGMLIQLWIPRGLSSGLTTEVHYDRIPALVSTVAERAEAIVGGCSESVRRYYQDTLAAVMTGPQPRLIYFVDITGGFQARGKDFEHLRRFVDEDEARRVDELRGLCKTKLEMDAHYTLQRALRWWVYAHVPLVGLLVVLVVLHVASVLYY